MPGTTTNFAINKPIGSDNNTREALCTTIDQIDTALKVVEDTAASAAAAASNIASAAVSALTTHKSDTTEHTYYAVDTGAANVYVVTLTPAPTAYVDGLTVRVKITNASTGASTLNVNGLGAKTILDSNGNAIAAGGLKAGLIYTMCYNATTGYFILQAKGGGTATAVDIISGKTATVDTGQVTGSLALTGTAVAANVLAGQTFYNTDPKTKVAGTIASKAAATITPGTADQTIAAGQYLSGAQTILGDANLAAANIVSGKTIFGVAGSHSDALPTKYQGLYVATSCTANTWYTIAQVSSGSGCLNYVGFAPITSGYGTIGLRITIDGVSTTFAPATSKNYRTYPNHVYLMFFTVYFNSSLLVEIESTTAQTVDCAVDYTIY